MSPSCLRINLELRPPRLRRRCRIRLLSTAASAWEWVDHQPLTLPLRRQINLGLHPAQSRWPASLPLPTKYIAVFRENVRLHRTPLRITLAASMVMEVVKMQQRRRRWTWTLIGRIGSRRRSLALFSRRRVEWVQVESLLLWMTSLALQLCQAPDIDLVCILCICKLIRLYQSTLLPALLGSKVRLFGTDLGRFSALRPIRTISLKPT